MIHLRWSNSEMASLGILALVGILFALPFWVSAGHDRVLGSGAEGRVDPFARRESTEVRRHAASPALLAGTETTAVKAVQVLAPPPVAESVHESFKTLVAELRDLLQLVHEQRDSERDLDRDQDRDVDRDVVRTTDPEARQALQERRAALEATRRLLDDEVVQAMRTDPILAFDLLSICDGGEGEKDRVVQHLVRLLRSIESPALTADLLDRLADEADPARRSLALIALESSSHGLEVTTLTRLLREDDDSEIRDQASAFLGRRLVDPRRRDERPAILSALIEGLRSETAQVRLQSLRPLRYLRNPDATVVGLVDSLREDAESSVRAEARLLWRIWGLQVG